MTRKNERPSGLSTNITMRDVALAAGVSVGTVSRVMNNLPGVKEENRRRVLSASARLGWSPNGIAASMRTSATRTIGLIIPDIRNPLYAGIERAAETTLRAQGYTLIVANSNECLTLEQDILSLMFRRRVDGLLIAPTDETNRDVHELLAASPIPIVLLEREISLPLDSVVSDQFGGVKQATEHLIAFGHRRIALVTGSENTRPGRERHLGYIAALQAAGIAIDPDLIRLSSFGPEFAFQAFQEIVQHKQPPTALITGGTLLLGSALRALSLLGKSIPRDISLLAVGDTDLATFAPPSFTAIRWDLAAIGRTAATMLLDRINQVDIPIGPRTALIPTEMVLRRSCGAMKAT